ncbi:MAG TPA: acetate/propionate family kinase [Rhodocyclaceae bacterium]|nr:acetate/propionate family kinase [Rhodocyclaceae bacterium]
MSLDKSSNAILVLNAGSSSIKFALFIQTAAAASIDRRATLVGQIDGIGATTPHFTASDDAGRTLVDQTLNLAMPGGSQHHHALNFLLGWLTGHDDGIRLTAVGHRVVHGAEKYARPILLNTAIRKELAGFIPLAPLHQPHNLAAIDAVADLLPKLPQVACFDTAFHRSQPEVAQRFALPRAITAQGVRRYGFHGLSYEYIAAVLPEHLDAQRADGRVVVAHLGNGASMCAMRQRHSIATTMGFTALDGLMMGTRAGSLDPGILLYLMEHQGMDAVALSQLLYKESGLLGVSGISQDMRNLLASKQPEAHEAIELFCYRIVRELGSLAAALGGLDALIFTGGIGEHAAQIRQAVCENTGWLGIELNATANSGNAVSIGTASSRVPVLVLPTNEEWMIARHTAELLQ